MKSKVKYVPVTPGDTPLIELAAKTEDQAWENLMKSASHLPHKDKAAFIKRGYSVEKWERLTP